MGLIAEIRINGRWERFGTYREGDSLIPENRPPGKEWAEIRTKVFERDDFTCQYCGVRGVRLECDHIFPVAKGGGHEMENLATACFPCNRSKRDKLLEDWLP